MSQIYNFIVFVDCSQRPLYFKSEITLHTFGPPLFVYIVLEGAKRIP